MTLSEELFGHGSARLMPLTGLSVACWPVPCSGMGKSVPILDTCFGHRFAWPVEALSTVVHGGYSVLLSGCSPMSLSMAVWGMSRRRPRATDAISPRCTHS